MARPHPWSQMRSLTPVTVADLATLACPYCGTVTPPDAEWVVEAVRTWGLCGWRIAGDGRTSALLLVAPSQSEPGCVLIMQLWVAPGATGGGLGKRLVQGAAAALKTSGAKAILSRGSRSHPSCGVPPRDFLRAVGFTRQLDERYYRLDLNRVVTDRNPLQALLDRISAAFQPGPGEPAAGGLSPRSVPRSD